MSIIQFSTSSSPSPLSPAFLFPCKPINPANNRFDLCSMVWTQSADRYLFTPIPALDLPNVRVSLLFMDASEISHTTTTEDPWFNATTPITGESLISNQMSQRYFVANEPTGVLGCVTQGYICNPTLPKGQDCRPIYSESYDNNHIAELWNDQKDIETVEGAMGAILGVLTTSPEAFYATAGVPSLLAGFSLMGPMQPVGLPANQWQKEAEYNFQNVLASMQAANIEVLTGKAPWTLMGGRPCPPQEGCRRICGHQVRDSSRPTNRTCKAYLCRKSRVPGSTRSVCSGWSS